MLNRIIYSNESKLKNNIEQTAAKVLETYSYGEVFIPVGDITHEDVCNFVRKELKDELLPLRIYNLNNHCIFFSLIGENNVKAYGEIILLCVNIALAIDLSDFDIKISLPQNMEKEIKEIVFAYEIDKHITFEESTEFSVTGIYKNNIFLSGSSKDDFIYAYFNMDSLLEILYTDKIKNATNLPLVLVGSDNLKYLHQTAFGLRAKGLTVETYIKTGTMYNAEEYAELKNITILMWITQEGRIIMKNIKNGEMSETTLDKVLKATE